MAVPVRIGECGLLAHAHERFDHVIDVSEVALHIAIVEDVDRFAGADRAGEQVHRHVWPAPCAVDGEEAQAGDGNTEEVRVGMRQQLVRFLGRRIKAEWVIDVLMHVERHLGHRAIDGAG